MNHADAEALLARRRELSPAEEARLHAHLDACPQCRETAEVFERQSSLLAAMPLAAPPPVLRARVLAAVEAAPRRRWSFRPTLLIAPLGVAAAAVLVAVVIQHPLQNSNTPRGAQGVQGSTTTHLTPTPGKGRHATPRTTPKKGGGHPRKGHHSRHGSPPNGASPSATGTTSGPGVSVALGPTYPYPAPGSRQGQQPTTGEQGTAPQPTAQAMPTSGRAVLSSAPRPTAVGGTTTSGRTGAVPPPAPVTGGGSTVTPQPRPRRTPTIIVAAPVTHPTAAPPPTAVVPTPVAATPPGPVSPVSSPTP